MNPVRPAVYPPMQPAQGPGAAKSAAQRAFFDQALGKAAGTPQIQTAPVQAGPTQAQPIQRMPTGQPTEAPTRILRPGSLLDIRV